MHCIPLCLLLLASAATAAEPAARRDVPYAGTTDAKQTLDIDAPPTGKDHPIVFWIHGGGWMQGDKRDVQNKPKAFVDKGFVFVSTNYRLFPNTTIKAMAGDVANAVRWTHDHAREFGGDPNRIFVMGHSAGAQLAALICTDETLLKAEGLPLSIIKGCVPVDGDTYDLAMQIATVEKKRADRYTWKFGDEQSRKELSPIEHVAKGKDIPPFLLLCVGGHPETEPQARRLAKALQEAGVPAKTLSAQNSEHDKLNNGLGLPGDKPTQALFEFVDGVLNK
ncbi:MAG TPA: alpha/beta hydrolase [Pirellulales bacterium]|nr:alpha/beta hydrolase [Pirellulales bacterium]